MWSLDTPDAARGRRYKRVVIDEAAMVANLQAAWEGAIRPTLADFEGDAWFLSTPKGYNYFHELYQRGQDEEQEDWASWQMPTSSNPHIHPDEIASAQRDLPPSMFAQEYLASFQAMADARFDLEVVNEALAACRPPLTTLNLPSALVGPLSQHLRVWALPRPGQPYALGIDGAEGKGRDYTVTVVFEARTLRHVATFRENVLEPSEHGAYAAQLAKWYNNAWCMVERSHGEAILVQLALAGCQVYHHDRRRREDGSWSEGTPGMPVTGQTRTGLIDDLAECIHDRSLSSDDVVFWRECQSFVYNDAGRPEAQPGAHDDCPSATWLAVRMARQPGAQSIREQSGQSFVRGYTPERKLEAARRREPSPFVRRF